MCKDSLEVARALLNFCLRQKGNPGLKVCSREEKQMKNTTKGMLLVLVSLAGFLVMVAAAPLVFAQAAHIRWNTARQRHLRGDGTRTLARERHVSGAARQCGRWPCGPAR